MKKTKIFLILPLLLVMLLPASVLAFEAKKDNSVYVAADQVVEGNLYAVGNSITVDGKVNGDIYCAGESITINGEVAGDVMCAGRSIVIDGPVMGSVRIAGQTINIKSQIAQNLIAFGQNIALEKTAEVGWEMLTAGSIAEIRGKVGGDLYGGTEKIIISGEIGKNIKLSTGSEFNKEGLVVEDSAVINGDVVYTDFKAGNISDKAMILGEITHNLPKQVDKIFTDRLLDHVWGLIYSIFATLVVGLVLISLWKKQIIAITDKMLAKAGVSTGWGFVLMFLSPIVMVILIFTVIGIPLAFLIFGAWLIAMCVSKILVGILVGRKIMEKIYKSKAKSLIWALVVGVVVIKFIFAVPVIGWLLAMVSAWWGLGGLWLYFRKA